MASIPLSVIVVEGPESYTSGIPLPLARIIVEGGEASTPPPETPPPEEQPPETGGDVATRLLRLCAIGKILSGGDIAECLDIYVQLKMIEYLQWGVG